MKKSKRITVAAFIGLAVLLLLFTIGNTTPTTWQIFEEQLPAAVESAGFRTIAMQSEASDRVSLPFGLLVRQLLQPEPSPTLVTGFPDSVQHYTMESVRNNAQLQCLVRYSSGKVAHIVLRFPPAARENATSLRDALRRVFPKDTVTLHETTEAYP